MEENTNKSGMGIASLVLGIISIISVLFWYITMPTRNTCYNFGSKRNS
ncbi:MAG: hypothetical protein HFJ54_04490 [Clostridia bacterium]|nr:hypothetical protein [Clostridia bacterium]